MDLSKEEFDLCVSIYFGGTLICKPVTKKPTEVNPNLIKLIELKVITEDRRISDGGGLLYVVRKLPLIIEFMKQFSLMDIVMSCISQDRISDACREILFKVTLSDLSTFLVHDNEFIRKVAKQRFDKLNKLNKGTT
jgi:hypothetical protein